MILYILVHLMHIKYATYSLRARKEQTMNSAANITPRRWLMMLIVLLCVSAFTQVGAYATGSRRKPRPSRYRQRPGAAAPCYCPNSTRQPRSTDPTTFIITQHFCCTKNSS